MGHSKGETKGTRIKIGCTSRVARAQAQQSKRRKKRLEALRNQRKSK